TLTAVNSEHIFATIDGFNVVFSASQDWFGTETLTFTVSDGLENASAEIEVTVLPVNDDPVIDLPDIVTFNEDSSLTEDLGNYISDIDFDELTLEIEGTNHIAAEHISPAPGTGLFFSQYMEGSGNNKFLEIYNASEATISLDNYALASCANTPSVPGEYEYWLNFNDGAEIEPGDIYIVAHPNASPEITGQADQFHQYLSNGDDGYAIVSGTEDNYTVIDRIGDWLADPGQGWDVAGVSNATKDHTLMRKANVLQGNPDWTASAGTNSENSEWIVMEKDDISGLGSHNKFVYLFTAEENWFGNEMITVSVNDNNGRSIVRDSMTVSVTPVNDTPEINLPDSITTYEDTPYTVNFADYIVDVENDEINLTCAGNTNIEVIFSGLEVTFNAPLNWNGSEMLYFTADDNQAETSDSVLVSFIAVNDAPVVAIPFEDIENVEDFDSPIEIDLNEHFFDADGDNLIYTVTVNDEEINAETVDNMLYLTSVENWSGTATVGIKADDEMTRINRNKRNEKSSVRDSVMTSFNVVLTNVNDMPVFASEAVVNATEDVEYIYNIVATDADLVYGDALTISAPTLPEWLTFTDNGNGYAVISGTPLNENVGENPVVISVIDAEGTAPVTQEFIIEVENVNDAPEIELPDEINIAEDETITVDFSQYISDSDADDNLLLTVSGNNNIGVTFDGLTVTLGSDTENWFGSETLTFTVNDQAGRLRNSRQNSARAIASDDIVINITPVNDSPYILAEIPEIDVNEDFPSYAINLENFFADPDGDELTYSVAFNDEEINAEIEESMMTISSVENWFGTASIVVTASDNRNTLFASERSGYRNEVSDTLFITVYPVNDAPYLVAEIPEINVDEDFEIYSIDLNDAFADPEGDELTYSVEFDDTETDISIDGSILTINSIENWFGTSQISITADDNNADILRTRRADYRAQLTVAVQVVVNPINDAPVMNSFSPEETSIEISDTTEFVFEVDVTDIDSDLDYVWTINDENQNINASSMTYNFDSAGTFTIKVEISDEDNTLEQQWTVISTVTENDNVNAPKVTQLLQNSPNPFNPNTYVRFDLGKDCKVKIDIYNVKGQLVKTLKNEIMSAGSHSVEWNGLTDNGEKSASGVYFIRMTTDNYRSMKKALMLK
ncbi:MAG: hypothetical protein CSB55_00360, partial [Candidatus Cloacimonadota bacterium]